LTDAYRFDPGIHLICTADRGFDSPGLAQASGGVARPAAGQDAAARQRRQRLGARCSNRCGDCPRTARSERRTPQRASGAAMTARDSGRRRGAGRQTAERRGGGAPARPTRRCRALARKQATGSFSSPPCDSPEDAHDDWKTTAVRSNGGGARDCVSGGGCYGLGAG
jgi:hypothetical protein